MKNSSLFFFNELLHFRIQKGMRERTKHAEITSFMKLQSKGVILILNALPATTRITINYFKF